MAMNSASSLDLTAHRLLGIRAESDLPAYFRADTKEKHGAVGMKIEEAPENLQTLDFRNPHSVDTLCRHFGISIRGLHTLSSSLLSRASAGESAKQLRTSQSRRLAMKSVAKGVERLRNKRHTEAMQHFNKALEIDPDNVDGLVGRGALYANCESYDLAVRDFNQALAIDPNHTNARSYLIETLLAQGKMFEKIKRYRKAQTSYEAVLHLDVDNEEANSRLRKANPSKMVGKRKLEFDTSEGTVRVSVHGNRNCSVNVNGKSADRKTADTGARSVGNPAEDAKLMRQLSDMEKFIAELKGKKRRSDDD